MHKILCFAILFFITSCTTERLADVSKQKPSDAGGSASKQPALAVYSLEIAPADAFRNSSFSLIPKGFSLSNAKIEWLVNGNSFVSPVPWQFKTEELKRSDMVQAKAMIEGREIYSNVIEIKNAAPEVTGIKILPEVYKPGDTLGVDVETKDIDGDDVTLSYEWTKNGEPAGNDKNINDQTKRGDKVSVKIIPFDGWDYGQSILLEREIWNTPPMIAENKDFNFDGKHYSYQVRAVDPDGDSLTYALKTAPEGMTINPETGLIEWNVPEDAKAETEFQVIVTDGYGGKSESIFYLTVTSEK